MPHRRSRLIVAAVLLATALVPAAADARPGAAARGTVVMTGTAYEFNATSVRLAGARIRIAEYPRLSATAGPRGRYRITVPDHASVTPYIEAAGHHTIFLQTFRTVGENLADVNFQTPSDAVYGALAGIVGVPLDGAGNPAQCVIVSTFSTNLVRDVSFDAFVGFGAHGVAGATAGGTPALPAPTYFNEQVIPDPAQRASSKDGGVLWTRVPTGTYTVSASHPTRRFASFTATCLPGRIVNANPPWGLHELGARNPATVSATWTPGAGRAGGPRLRALRVTGAPRGATVRVTCTGAGCPFATRTLAAPAGTADVAGALGAAARRLAPGQTLELRVLAHGFDGRVIRWRLMRGATPSATPLCLPLGGSRPRSAC